MKKYLKVIISELLACFKSEGILGGFFMSPPDQHLLYNPSCQSETFIQLTPTGVIPSIAVIVLLSIAHSLQIPIIPLVKFI